MTTEQKQFTPTPGLEVRMKMSPLEAGKLWQKALFLEKERDALAAKVKELEDQKALLYDAVSVLNNSYERALTWRNELLEAAQAVIDRWHTPLWKDAPATAVFIGKLQSAVEKYRPKKEPQNEKL